MSFLPRSVTPDPQRFDEINRYFSEPAYRDQVHAERAAVRERLAVEDDAREVARQAGPDEPGYVGVFRDRVIEYARREHYRAVLVMANLSDDEIERVLS